MSDTIRGNVFTLARAIARCDHPSDQVRTLRVREGFVTAATREGVEVHSAGASVRMCQTCGAIADEGERHWVRPTLVGELVKAIAGSEGP